MGATILEAGTAAVITSEMISDTPPVNLEQLAPLFPIRLGVGIPQFWEEVAQEQHKPA